MAIRGTHDSPRSMAACGSGASWLQVLTMCKSGVRAKFGSIRDNLPRWPVEMVAADQDSDLIGRLFVASMLRAFQATAEPR